MLVLKISEVRIKIDLGDIRLDFCELRLIGRAIFVFRVQMKVASNNSCWTPHERNLSLQSESLDRDEASKRPTMS